ncbi:MAG: hypothetical protein ACP5OZ_01120 [Candidatus Woesearchaeota archaeon]
MFFSLAKIYAAISFGSVLILLIPYLISASLISSTEKGVDSFLEVQGMSHDQKPLNTATILLTFIFYLIASPIAGFIIGLIQGVLYNLFSNLIGGLKLDLEQVETEVDRPLGTEPTQ